MTSAIKVSRRYTLGWVKERAESMLKAMGMSESVINVELREETDFYEIGGGVELYTWKVRGGFIEFDLAEAFCSSSPTDSMQIGYQPVFCKQVPSFNRDIPPEEDIIFGEVERQPHQALEEGIMRCVRETLGRVFH